MGSVNSSDYTVSLEVSEIEAGDSESSAMVKVSIERDKNMWGDGAIEVNLTWKCEIGEANRKEEHKSSSLFKEGSVTVFIPSGEKEAETKITGMPAKPSLEQVVNCSIAAKGAITAGGSSFTGRSFFTEEYFTIENGPVPELAIEIITSKFASPNAFVQLKLLLTRNGKPLTEGDAWFAGKAEIEINWSCGSANGSQKANIDEGKSDKIVKVELPSVSEGDYCSVYAQIPFSNTPIDKNFTVGEDKLKIVLTKHTLGEALGYIVTEDNKRFTDMVNLEIFGAEWKGIKYCTDTYLVQLAEDKNSVNYGRTISNVAPENEDSVFLVGHSGTCSIAVTSDIGDLQKQGATFSAQRIGREHGDNFVLQIQDAKIVPIPKTISGQPVPFKGKVWVYLITEGSINANLKGYLDTGNSPVSTATKLRTSADEDTEVSSLSAGFYIIFYEQENILRVFSGQYN